MSSESFAKSCPGSKSVREPTPELLACPNCGEEVEVWTHELSHPCQKCGTRVFRPQRASCIDWCPHAKECVGVEIYKTLKPDVESTDTPAAGPLDSLTAEHDEALKRLASLRTAMLFYGLVAKHPEQASYPVMKQSMDTLGEVMAFFDRQMREHFRREEDVLFPLLDRHMSGGATPTSVLLEEHAAVWKLQGQLVAKLAEFKKDGSPEMAAVAGEAYDISNKLVSLLQGHIKKEQESLLPLARKLLTGKELEEVTAGWR